MDILSYVQELLQQQAAVCVTGLGTFYKKKSAGRYDKEKKSFLPPSYVLQFSADSKESDELGIFISGKKGISVESSNYYINQFAAEVNRTLELEHEIQLTGLGRLYFTEHEGLSFDPEKNINLGSEFFGLPEIPQVDVPEVTFEDTIEKDTTTEPVHEEIAEAPKVQDFDSKTEPGKVEPIIENIHLDEVKDDLKHTLKHSPAEIPEADTEAQEQFKTYVSLEGEQIAKPVEHVEAPDFIKEQHAEHPNRFGHNPALDEVYQEEEKSPWLKIIISVLVLATIAASIYFAKPEWFKPAEKLPAPTAVLDSVKIDSAQLKIDSTKIKQDSTAKTDSILKAHQVKPAVKDTLGKMAVINSTNKTVQAVPSGPISYNVIAASFKTEAKAQVFVKEMKAYGLDAKVIDLPGKRKKVSIASFKTEKEAYEKRPELAAKIKIKDLDIIPINTTP